MKFKKKDFKIEEKEFEMKYGKTTKYIWNGKKIRE